MADPKHITGDDYVYILDESGKRIVRISEFMESYATGGTSLPVGTVVQAVTPPGAGWVEATGDLLVRQDNPRLSAIYPDNGWDYEIVTCPSSSGFSSMVNTGNSLLAIPYGAPHEFNYYSTQNLYRSEDLGKTWELLYGALPNVTSFGSCFAISQDSSRILVVDRNGFGVKYSDDDGLTWTLGGDLPWGVPFSQYGGDYDTWCTWNQYHKFIAFKYGNPGRIARSPDGITWTETVLTSPVDLRQFGYGMNFLVSNEDARFSIQARNNIGKYLRFDPWDLSIGYEQQDIINLISPNFWGLGFGVKNSILNINVSADTTTDLIEVENFADMYSQTFLKGLNPFGYKAVVAHMYGTTAIGEYGPNTLYGKTTSDGINWKTCKLVQYDNINSELAYNIACDSGDGIIMASGLFQGNTILRIFKNPDKFNVDYIPEQNGVKSYIYAGV